MEGNISDLWDDNDSSDDYFLEDGHHHPSKTNQNWAGVDMLGKGVQGMTGLRVEYDKYHNIIARMAVKHCQLARSKFDREDICWIDASHAKHQAPREAIIGTLLDDASVVKTLAYRVDKDHLSYRIYMEFNGFSCLEDLPNAQGKREILNTEDKGSRMKTDVPFPEPFCWLMLMEMARAANEMAQPTWIRGNRMRLAQWKNAEVVHQDIKVNNVFMADPDPRSFPNYPRPVLGDFGSARLTYDGDESNCLAWRDPVTKGYIAPEMNVGFRFHGYPWGIKSRLTSATNVWQIGRNLRTIMNLERNVKQIKYSKYPDDKDKWRQPPMTGLTPIYSKDLIDIVEHCLDTLTDNRPMPTELMNCCAVTGQGHLQGMADPALAYLPGRRRYRLRPSSRPVDIYKVGMVVNIE